MKATLLLCSALFGLWFWQRPAPARNDGWPADMPVFCGGRADSSYVLKSGSSFVSLTVAADGAAALAAAQDAFAAAGWQVTPIRTRDMLIFTRGDSVAAVLAEGVPGGTRVTAYQRPKGL